MRIISNPLIICVLFMLCASTPSSSFAGSGTLYVKSTKATHTLDRTRLLGTNAALWHEPDQLDHPQLGQLLKGMTPAYIRIPGGSWSDEYYWNGHDIWQNEAIDTSKLKDGVYQVDYSGYSPGFRIQGADRMPSDYHSSEGIDIQYLHDFAQQHGRQAIVTVNAGTGSPEMAAEWVRWANANNYDVAYWEVGNELEGEWELGHFLPDGSKMTGEVYAHRFIEFAKAMKAVDPTIKVGGPTASSEAGGFTEDLLRIAGDHVDFISFHSYPVEKHLGDEQQIFEQAFSLRQSMPVFKEWIQKYQPDRVDEIEIGITEWNSKVIEDRDTGGIINGLWTCLWIGEMFRNGIDFATQWDMLTVTEEGGHGLFHHSGGYERNLTTPLIDGFIPKSQYWAMVLWAQFMGNQLLPFELEGPKHLQSYVTRSEDALRIMLINTSREKDALLNLDLPMLKQTSVTGIRTIFSHSEYFWNHLIHQPEWSHYPSSTGFKYNSDTRFTVSPFSVQVLEIPLIDSSMNASTANMQRNPSLRLLLPKEAPADLPIEGWALVGNGGFKSDDLPDYATLEVKGPAESYQERVRIRESAGRFMLHPTGPGKLQVHIKAGEKSADAIIDIQKVKERPEVFWHFEDQPAAWQASSSFSLEADANVRPNQQIAAIRINNQKPDKGSDVLALFEPLPSTLPKERIGGVIFEVQASPDLLCDADLGLSVILQSDAAHWIPLGSIDLKKHKGEWISHTLRLPEAHYFEAMGKTYALRFQLYQKKEQKVPVNGSVYLDNVGFILR